jgi:hypothetical protein
MICDRPHEADPHGHDLKYAKEDDGGQPTAWPKRSATCDTRPGADNREASHEEGRHNLTGGVLSIRDRRQAKKKQPNENDDEEPEQEDRSRSVRAPFPALHHNFRGDKDREYLDNVPEQCSAGGADEQQRNHQAS